MVRQTVHMLQTVRFRALGTEVLIRAPGAEAMAARLEAMVAGYERRFSRFLATSEVACLSAGAGGAVVVSEDLFELLTLAMSYWRETDGLFDPLILPDLEAAGYDRIFDSVPAESPGPPNSPRPARAVFGGVLLNPSRRSVRLPAGARLDLGGIAKGWIVDRIEEAMVPGAPFLVDVGGDMAGRGDGPDGGPGWLLAVDDPFRPHEDRAWLRLRNGAVATSTIMRRRCRRSSRWQHHLIDPRTGAPAATGVVQVTVRAPTAVRADVCAKTALVLGAGAGAAWLSARWLPGLVITVEGALIRTPEWRRVEVPME
jgi:FAD:protein FMN transferase